MKRWMLFALPMSMITVLVVCWSMLSLLVLCGLLFATVFCVLITLSFSTAPLTIRLASPSTSVMIASQTMPNRNGFPCIPRTVEEIHRTMTDREFELFSAAVIIALGQGHTFYRHTGRTGDQGVDTLLLNMYRHRVAVQSKLHRENIGSPELRGFYTAIRLYNAVYGYFVTTSSFTPDAQWVIDHPQSLIHTIDGRQLERYLQTRSHEIALAYSDILNAVSSESR